jgi:hypothetical protein
MTDSDPTFTRRRALRAAGVVGAVALGASPAAASKPDFSPRIWGDGEQWGTKVTGTIPEPNNKDSLDKFFVVTNPVTGNLPDGTMPVSEAAPRNPMYNGGRWYTHTVAWTETGIEAHGETPPLLTRYGPADDPESIAFHYELDHLTITEGPPEGGPPPFFSCPLLPVKD